MKTDETDPNPTNGTLDPCDAAPTKPAIPGDPAGGVNDIGEIKELAEGRSLWIAPTVMKKLKILKEDMDVPWSLLMEIVCEQLLAASVVSEEAQKKIRALGYSSVDMASGDRYWRGAFGVGEPWSEAAATQAKIRDEVTLINSALGELVQAVEDHATIIVECNHIMTLEDNED